MLSVFLRHVGRFRRSTGMVLADVAGDALMLEIDFDQAFAGLDFHLLAKAMMRHRIQMPIILDVVIDIDPCGLDCDRLIGVFRQR